MISWMSFSALKLGPDFSTAREAVGASPADPLSLEARAARMGRVGRPWPDRPALAGMGGHWVRAHPTLLGTEANATDMTMRCKGTRCGQVPIYD